MRILLWAIPGLLAGGLALAAPGTAVKVSGEKSFKIESGADGYRIKGEGLDGYRIRPQGPEASVLSDAKGAPVLRAQGQPEGDVRITEAASGKLVLDRRAHGEGFEIRDASGARLYRVKWKPDQFNLYDAHDKRILRGKPKPGSVNIKPEGSDERELKVSGTDSHGASYLALPIEVRLRALLWAHAVEGGR